MQFLAKYQVLTFKLSYHMFFFKTNTLTIASHHQLHLCGFLTGSIAHL